MEDNFFEYLDSLNTSNVIKNRVDYILKVYTKTFDIDINDIFISEYIKENNERVFENLWLFNSFYLMEAKNFVTNDDFDTMTLKNNIIYWQFKKQEFDFGEATEKSRLFLHIRNTDVISGDFKASKGNCSKLFNIFKKYIHPNIRSPNP